MRFQAPKGLNGQRGPGPHQIIHYLRVSSECVQVCSPLPTHGTTTFRVSEETKMGNPSTAAWNARATQGRSGQRRDAAPSYLLLTEGQQHNKSQTAEHGREWNRLVPFLGCMQGADLSDLPGSLRGASLGGEAFHGGELNKRQLPLPMAPLQRAVCCIPGSTRYAGLWKLSSLYFAERRSNLAGETARALSVWSRAESNRRQTISDYLYVGPGVSLIECFCDPRPLFARYVSAASAQPLARMARARSIVS